MRNTKSDVIEPDDKGYSKLKDIAGNGRHDEWGHWVREITWDGREPKEEDVRIEHSPVIQSQCGRLLPNLCFAVILNGRSL